MNRLISTVIFGAALLAAADKPQSFTGVITETMCGAKHTMGITPDNKCVRECMKSGSTDPVCVPSVEWNQLCRQ